MIKFKIKRERIWFSWIMGRLCADRGVLITKIMIFHKWEIPLYSIMITRPFRRKECYSVGPFQWQEYGAIYPRD